MAPSTAKIVRKPKSAAPRLRFVIRLQRAYIAPSKRRTFRVLVDRLWPRGVKKEEFLIDSWLKNVDPSATLRRWFGHRPDRWAEFRRRYLHELAENGSAVEELATIAAKRSVTLVWSKRRGAQTCNRPP